MAARALWIQEIYYVVSRVNPVNEKKNRALEFGEELSGKER